MYIMLKKDSLIVMSKKHSKNSKSTAKETVVFQIPENVELPPKDDEELELEKLVFGDFGGFEDSLKNIGNMLDSEEESDNGSDIYNKELSDRDDSMEQLQDAELFTIDGGDSDTEMKNNNNYNEDEESSTESDVSEAAWTDSDDENININILESYKMKKLRSSYEDKTIPGKAFSSRLRTQFEKIYPRPKWADRVQQSEQKDNSDEESQSSGVVEVSDKSGGFNSQALLKIIESASSIRSKPGKILTPKTINIARLRDANQKHLSKSAIQTIQFHPELPVLLTGGYDKTLRLYHIDGKHNNVVTTLHFKNSPIQNAYFATVSGASKVFLAGRRRFMYKLDLSSGQVEKITSLYGIEKLQKSFENFKVSPLSKFIGLIGNSGYVNILSISNGSFYKNFKIDGVVADFNWSSDETKIIIVSTAGFVFEFDFVSGTPITKWQDENGIGITKFALGGKGDRFMAVGSANGIVNVYDRFKMKDSTKPVGVVSNLVTSISSIVFNHDGQLLCVASRAKRDALRLVHIPSCSVYSNWPTSGTPLGKVTAIAFSSNSELLAVGNEAGKARLFQLNDY